MTRYVLVVAALLLTGLASDAVAADDEQKHFSKNAAKVIATLETAGIKNKYVNYLVNEVDKRIEGRYFNITEDRVMGGRMLLHYEMGKSLGTRRFELMYTPSDDSNFTYTARTNAIMIHYRYQFKY